MAVYTCTHVHVHTHIHNLTHVHAHTHTHHVYMHTTTRYVQEDILQPGDPNYRQFHKIFEMFKISEPETKPEPQESPMQLVAKAVEASKKMAAAMAAEKKRESSDEEEEETEKAREGGGIGREVIPPKEGVGGAPPSIVAWNVLDPLLWLSIQSFPPLCFEPTLKEERRK